MAGTITVGGLADGLLSGEKVIGPLTVEGTAVVGQVVDVALAVGDNPVSVPAAATAVVLAGAPTNTSGAVTVRTTPGDAGMFVAPNGLIVWTFDPANRPVALILHSTGGGQQLELSFI